MHSILSVLRRQLFTSSQAFAGIAAVCSMTICSLMICIGINTLGTISSVAADEPKQAYAGVFDPKQWKLTLPIAGEKGKAREVLNPEFATWLSEDAIPADVGFYFRIEKGKAVLRSVYTGVTTSKNTSYSRCELREMRGREQSNWTLETSGSMTARLKVSDLKNGAKKLIVLQIHGHRPESKPLLKIVWEQGMIRILTKSGKKLKDFKRKQHYTAVAADEWFTCQIVANRESVNIKVNGETIESFGEEILKHWPANNTYYFKAGNYLQHDTPGCEATVMISSLQVSH